MLDDLSELEHDNDYSDSEVKLESDDFDTDSDVEIENASLVHQRGHVLTDSGEVGEDGDG